MDHSSNLPPLDTLRAFEAAARTGSFSSAAEALNLTHGAVSRQVAKLEHWLGYRVFLRQARGVSPTPEGQRLLLRTQELISRTFLSLEFYFFAGFLYFVINYSIERFGKYVERKTSTPS